MYRANDPRFRRRLNEIGQTLESANESAQSNIYIFTQTYIKPCFESVSSYATACVDASCPSLNLSQRDRLRRQRGRSRGGAELSFDFYDDWDEEENDALLGWGGNDEFDRLLSTSGSYGAVAQTQPTRQRGMSYPKARRKSILHDDEAESTVIQGNQSFLGRLFGGKALRYKPSAADLQDNPGTRRLGRQRTEGEALLEEHEGDRRRHTRKRSGTASSGQTSDSLSSRGDIFPSDEEDDAVPFDDEFAMVLERRTTQSGGHEADSSSGHTRDMDRRRGKRPSRSRASTGRLTVSSRGRNSTSSSAIVTPVDEVSPEFNEPSPSPPTMAELKQEEDRIEQLEEAEVQRRRAEAQRLAVERGLSESGVDELSSKEDTPETTSPAIIPLERLESTEHDASAAQEATAEEMSLSPDQPS